LATLRASSLRAKAFKRLAAVRRCESALSMFFFFVEKKLSTQKYTFDINLLFLSRRRLRRAARRASLRRADASTQTIQSTKIALKKIIYFDKPANVGSEGRGCVAISVPPGSSKRKLYCLTTTSFNNQSEFETTKKKSTIHFKLLRLLDITGIIGINIFKSFCEL
jgi:hypothetical protein